MLVCHKTASGKGASCFLVKTSRGNPLICCQLSNSCIQYRSQGKSTVTAEKVNLRQYRTQTQSVNEEDLRAPRQLVTFSEPKNGYLHSLTVRYGDLPAKKKLAERPCARTIAYGISVRGSSLIMDASVQAAYP